MIRLKETLFVERSLPYVFRYTSDFANIQDWDPGVISSSKIHSKESGVGAAYDLVLKFGPFRPKMKYEIIEYEPYSKVVLKGAGDTFSAIDTIFFTKKSTGTQIDYQADIRFYVGGRYLEWFLSPVINRIGRTAILGLKQTFDGKKGRSDHNERFKSGACLPDYLADHAIAPGMLMFSRYGYELSKKFWTAPKETLFGKKVILTGGTSGIGKATAFKLAEKKAFLTIIARNPEKAQKVQQEIIEKTGNPHVDFLISDLSLMQDICRVARQVKSRNSAIDILINNAGALFNERKETVEGLEQTFATDLLGVFYLTELLKDCLARSTDARIINVSSGGMYTQKIDVDDLENKFVPYNGAKAYARAKRGIVILTRMWSETFKKHGITVNAMHPGWVDTPGIEQTLPRFHQLLNGILRTPLQGADTIVWLALSRSAGQRSGLFWLDRRPRETVVFPFTGASEKDRRKLWNRLHEMIANNANLPPL